MIKPFAVIPLIVLVVIAGLGIYWQHSNARKAEAPETTQNTSLDASVVGGVGFSKALAKGSLAGFLVHPERRDIQAFSFADATGAMKDLSQWKGKVVLLNLWATWCAPCRKEMPDIAKLQAEMGSADFEVIALSVDRKGLEASKAFLKDIGAESLKTYVDPESKSLAALQALGLPATLLIDRNGKEAGRLLGPADWASDESKALVKALLAEK